MNQSLNNSFDSFIENIFSKNDSPSEIANDPATDNSTDPYRESMITQRNNLILLLRLVIKDLFKHRSKILNPECRIYFDQLFVLLEKCLHHGLKQRKQMFSIKIDIWNVIELIGKNVPESSDIIESVRHLPKIRTPAGKARAWFRLAMMKKKLSEYFQILIDLRETVLREYYEGFALIMTEDANVLAGLLVGLNSFDYYVYIKDEAFDYEPVIDLRHYLKETCLDNSNGGTHLSNGKEEVNVDALLEQNNYIEEINEHLKSTIKTLENKLELLTEKSMNNTDGQATSSKSLMEFGTALVNKEKQIMEEERLRKELEKKLEEELKLRNECETVRNLLERDIQEKQDTIVSLRSQLDEVKAINIQIFNKMQESDKEIKGKDKLISDYDVKIGQLKKEVAHLDKKLNKKAENVCDKEILLNNQKLIDEQQEQITQMQLEIEDLKTKGSFNSHLKEAYSLLKKKFEENELALEEIGKQLQDSKLEIESLKEYNGHLKEAAWAKDSEATKCKQCDRDFTLARRKHHCRSCGEIFCSNCSNNEMPLPSSKKPVRVCDGCHAFLLDRYSPSS